MNKNKTNILTRFIRLLLINGLIMLNSIEIIDPAFKTCTSLSRTGNASLKQNKVTIIFY